LVCTQWRLLPGGHPAAHAAVAINAATAPTNRTRLSILQFLCGKATLASVSAFSSTGIAAALLL
jgi:hypothetical protein